MIVCFPVRVLKRGRGRRGGFTLVELLVVIAIIGILIALLLPAVQAAREAARRSQCTNNLKQLALAAHNFHDVHRVFPPCYNYRANATSTTTGQGQPAHWTWFTHILPFLEQKPAYDLIDVTVRYDSPAANPNVVNRAKIQAIHVPGFFCPSRRSGVNVMKAQTFTGGTPRGIPASTTSDYAAATVWSVRPGVTDPATINYWTDRSLGAIVPVVNPNDPSKTASWWPLSQPYSKGTAFSDIRDGTSSTVLIGEKHLHQECLNVGSGQGDTECQDGSVLGMDWFAQDHVLRLLDVPLGLGPHDGPPGVNPRIPNRFGSWHPGVCQFALCDGSVRGVSVTASLTLLANLADRRDGQVVQMP